MRTGGAAYLAGRGIHPLTLQSLGRWRSSLVAYYAGESLHANVANDLLRPSASSSPGLRSDFSATGPLALGPAASTSSQPAQQQTSALTKAVAEMEQRISQLESTQPPQVESENEPCLIYLRNERTRVWHITRCQPHWHEQYQKAACGWQFMRTKYIRLHVLPPLKEKEIRCSTCFGLKLSLDLD